MLRGEKIRVVYQGVMGQGLAKMVGFPEEVLLEVFGRHLLGSPDLDFESHSTILLRFSHPLLCTVA